jgi:lycopene cyclase domain-containing protein
MLEGNYSYLWLNLLSIAAPFLLSFDKRVAFFKTWPRLMAGILVMALVFIPWDMAFTHYGVWGFNSAYITGIHLFNLPLEECMFFFCIPYASIFIYACLKGWIPDFTRPAGPYLAAITLSLSLALAFLYSTNVYTLVTFLLLPLTIILHFFIHGTQFFGRFFLMWAIHLIPFLIINGVLTARPIVWYNNEQNMNIRIGTIPFEDMWYSMLMLLIVLTVYEPIRKIKKKQEST